MKDKLIDIEALVFSICMIKLMQTNDEDNIDFLLDKFQWVQCEDTLSRFIRIVATEMNIEPKDLLRKAQELLIELKNSYVKQ
jgi:hypothetical protein